MDAGASLHGGRYVVRGVLGEGAQGVTYDAVDMQSRSAVAVKRFNMAGAASWKEVELAEREARVLSTLDHPLVPRYVEHFEDGGNLYLVMEKVEGETLEAIRSRQGPLPEAEVRRFLACADRALTYLHGRGSPIVHRDIKPRNVVRRPDGTYVLVDFGAVREVFARGNGTTVVGTMGYMAPEQFQGRALPASDVYAVGATALAALGGVEPETLRHRGLRTDVRGAIQGRASEEVVAAIEQMMEPDPDLRPSLSSVLDGMNARSSSIGPLPVRAAQVPSQSQAPPAPWFDAVGREETAVASIRKLLWTLWALGWILVPLICSHLGIDGAIPIVMFGGLAALIVVTWHKGAAIRVILRRLGATRRVALPQGVEAAAPPALGSSAPPAEAPQLRVAVDSARVRVADPTTDPYSATEVTTAPPEERTARRT